MAKSIRRLTDCIITALRRISIRRRLIAAFVLVGVVPSVLLTVFTFGRYVQEINSTSQKFISLLMQNLNTQAAGKLGEYESMVMGLYRDADFTDALERAVNGQGAQRQDAAQYIGRRLYTAGTGASGVLGMQVVTLAGEQIQMQNSFGEPYGAHLRDAAAFCGSALYTAALERNGYPIWFDTSRETELFFRSERDNSGISDYVTLLQTVYSAAREPLGVVCVNLRVADLTESFTSYSFYGSGNTFLLSHSNVLAGLRSNTLQPSLTFAQGDLAGYFAGDQGSFTQRVGEQSLFVTYRRIDNTDVYIAHVSDQNQLLVNAYQIRNLCLVLTGCVVVLCVLAAGLTTGSIVRPVDALSRSTKAFIKNKFNVRAEVAGRDEISELSRDFNSMVDGTNRLIEDLYVSQLHQKNLELERKTAELNALQMQMDPHFLYNTLDMIRYESMYEAGRDSTAGRMLTELCRLLRSSVKGGGAVATLAEELEHVSTYLKVLSFGGRHAIVLECDVPPALMQAQLPRFTLQPLVENAVRHGLRQPDGACRGTIRLRGQEGEAQYTLEVWDNGSGMARETLHRLRERLAAEDYEEDSVGLVNVYRRLRLSYGANSGLTLESPKGGGTCVRITWPVGRGEEQDV